MDIYFVTIGIFIIAFVIWMINYLTTCPHQWKVIERYERKRITDNKLLGYVLIKECQVCHKIKKEIINF